MPTGMRILLVEDEPIIATDIDMTLSELGFGKACVVAHDLDSALEAASNSHFDLAILDVNLRGKKVWPVAEKLRAKGIPHILMTGEILSDCQKSVPVVSKPFDSRALVAAVTMVLNQRG